MHLKNTIGKAVWACALVGAMAIPTFSPGLAKADSYPSERLNWTIAFGPGGGNDIMSRTIISILEKYKLYPGEIVAQNRPGGSGAVGWGFVHNQKGNPYHITSTSGSYITTPLKAKTPWSPTTFTPVALLAADDLVLLVNGKSKITSFDQFIKEAKAKPPAVGGMGAVNVDFIVPTLLAEKAGYKFEYVSFNKQGELTTALLSDALDAMVANPGEVAGLIESGDLRALAFSGKKTPESLKDVPTFGDKGYELGISMPRGVVLPPEAPKEAQEWWIATMKKVVEKPEWAAYVKKHELTETVLWGEDFRNFLAHSQEQFARVLKAKGAIK
ncbi:tripartite tricarboxylate transporter substrate binding protein [bacterium SCSIO 12827]|nr:tripartite tricarboxylate transporter substrate binding protein [bacterium SCSIO 12827]